MTEEDDLYAFDQDKLDKDKKLVMREFGQKLRANIGKIPFAEDVTAAFYCAMDGDSPAFVKAILFGALAYFIMPADVIPDFIAGLGFTDDASVLMAAISTVQKHVTDRHRDRARKFLEKEQNNSSAS
ncbi:YkvA family protein [Sneathiella limimaris]|uniref:YkvA family protein n=1 Tax=Sneathiella limimaris TaxID=1964213 RepID=UPI00146B6974|nr:YkvA family protein [Sneathiella limimaris]